MALNQGFEYTEQISGRGRGCSVLDYLASRYRHSSRGEWVRRLERGEVFVDAIRARADDLLKSGQWLVWRRPAWDEPDVPLDYAVLYEDDDLLAVAKPGGLPCVPAGGFLLHTLLTLVQRRYPDAVPIHRLGRGTSGVVLFARSKRARSVLCCAMRRQEIVKTYRALAEGNPSENEFTIRTPIGLVPHARLGSIHARAEDGKPASSRAVVLERRGESVLLEVCIQTGKPHQIRIHLASAGHPLVGDPLYAVGGGVKATGTALPGDSGYLLHAHRIRFCHPATGVPLEIECPPPPGLRLIRRKANIDRPVVF